MKEAYHRSVDQKRVRASAQRPPPHARISISRRRQAGTGPPSLHLHTNSCAPATHRLIKAMHLFMTELIKQWKRWSQLWKHISPQGNCLWSRSPQAPSGHRFWIFLTYKEKANYNALKNLLWGNGVMVQDISLGYIWSCLNWSHNYMYRSSTGGWADFSPSGLVFCIFVWGYLGK